MKTRYYVCGLGYDEDARITDYERYFGSADTYEEAYELFVKTQCRDIETLFVDAPEFVYELLIQLEECEEGDDEINCIDVRNEWLIKNPNFKEEK